MNSGQTVAVDEHRADLDESARWELVSENGGYASGPNGDYAQSEVPGDVFTTNGNIGGPVGYEQTGGTILMSSTTAGGFHPDFIRSPEFLEGYEKWEGRTKPLEPLFLDQPGALPEGASDEEKAKHDEAQAKFDASTAKWVEKSQDESNITPSDEGHPPTGEQGVVPEVSGPISEPPTSGSGSGRSAWVKYVSTQFHLEESSLAQFSRDELIEKYAVKPA